MNFSEIDIFGVLRACLALAPFVFAPGYAIGWALNVFEFRQRRPLLRLILAVPLSIAICPIFTYLLARFAPAALWLFYAGSAAACVLLLARDLRRVRLATVSKQVWTGVGLLLLWIVLGIGLSVDVQIGERLYPSLSAYDHSVRIAMTAAVARHVPPSNPFFAHPAVPLRYHYLWILFCSLPAKLFHLSPVHVTYAGVVWCGIGFICSVALGLKFLLRELADIARKTLIGVGLLCVTGLDIVPILFLAAVNRWWIADMEWWNDAPIASWASSLLWVPHHVAALIACFLGFLVLRHAAGASRRVQIITVLIAGTAFASGAGMSMYVSFTFVIAIGLWLIVLFTQKHWSEVFLFAGAGAVAAMLALPYLLSLNVPGAGTGFAEFAIRRFLGPNAQDSPVTVVINAGFLPFGYALELGFFLVAGILRFRQLRRGTIAAGADEIAAWTLLAASFLVGTFLQSSTISTNDLGIRCFLPAQLVLLLWGAVLVDRWWFARQTAAPAPRLWVRSALLLLLVLGVLGSAYEVFMMRFSVIVYERWGNAGLSWMDPDWQFGKRTYAVRSLYESLNATLPSSAIIQHNPATKSFVSHILYSGHDAVAGWPDCGTAFGGERQGCEQRVRRLVALFANQENFESVCQDYGIDVLVAQDTDPAWRDRSSWIWKQTPLIGNDRVRALPCGIATAGMKR